MSSGSTAAAGFEFGAGYEERIPLILVLDTSGSMARPAELPRIEQLVDTVEHVLEEMRAEPALAARVDVAVVSFGSTVAVRTDLLAEGGHSAEPFVPVGRVRMPKLAAAGHSPMLPAVSRALEIGARRRTELAGRGVPCLRPVIWLITDGAPTDEGGELLGEAECALTAADVRAAEDAGNCLFFAIGVADADRELLRTIAPGGTYMVGGLNYPEILQLITTSSQQSRSVLSADEVKDAVRERHDRGERIRRLEQSQ
ncbi:MAG TPA: VWA domain-containing protein [Actinospica sp.]|nr:VWA domain-containing protein [Actinospica sp.]